MSSSTFSTRASSARRAAWSRDSVSRDAATSRFDLDDAILVLSSSKLLRPTDASAGAARPPAASAGLVSAGTLLLPPSFGTSFGTPLLPPPPPSGTLSAIGGGGLAELMLPVTPTVLPGSVKSTISVPSAESRISFSSEKRSVTSASWWSSNHAISSSSEMPPLPSSSSLFTIESAI